MVEPSSVTDFIAPCDREILTPLLHECHLKLGDRPQPWVGDPKKATVFMLALNPGFSPKDHVHLRNRDYAKQWQLALSFKTRTPFYFLDPAFRGVGGGQYWERRLKELICEVGIHVVRQRVMCVEHFPYKSARYTRSCRCIRLSNPRNPYLSRAQMTGGEFRRLVKALHG